MKPVIGKIIFVILVAVLALVGIKYESGLAVALQNYLFLFIIALAGSISSYFMYRDIDAKEQQEKLLLRPPTKPQTEPNGGSPFHEPIALPEVILPNRQLVVKADTLKTAMNDILADKLAQALRASKITVDLTGKVTEDGSISFGELKFGLTGETNQPTNPATAKPTQKDKPLSNRGRVA